MKKLLGFIVLLFIGVFLYRRYANRNDPLQQHLAEQDALMQIGYQKQAVNMDAQIPWAQIGDTPLAGVWQTALLPGPGGDAKPLQLFPKGPFKLEVDPEISVGAGFDGPGGELYGPV